MPPRPCPSAVLPVLPLVLFLATACSASEATRSASEGAKLYDAGNYEGALPLLEKADRGGAQDGELFYQLAYIYDLQGKSGEARKYREKALALLDKKVASGNASLEVHYYRTALYFNLQRPEEMKKAAGKGINEFGKAKGLSGSDLFRLGRLYQFLERGRESAQSYRKATQAFAKERDPNPILYSLALAADGRVDLADRRFSDASRKFERALQVNSKAMIAPLERALAHLGAGKLDEALSDLAQVKEEEDLTEAQYATDLVKHLKKIGGPSTVTPSNQPLMELDNDALLEKIQSAAESLRTARTAEGANGSSKSVQEAERLFFSLVWEWMIRGNPMREPALAGGYADLIRR